MPELPDVESFKKCLNKKALNKKIKDISFGSKASKILKNSKSYFKDHVVEKKFSDVERHGKHLFIGIGSGKKNKILEMHFGMTGFLDFYTEKSEKESEHPRVVFKIFQRGKLVYDCQRLLGELKVVDSKEEYLKKHNIGKDALDFREEEFVELMGQKNGKVKPALMSQKDIAGIGNIYADEILFHSKIHPEKEVSDIKEKDLKKLHKNMVKVLKKAIEKNANIENLPSSWIIPKRHTKNTKCPRKNCKGNIKSVKVNSRTSFYCPKCQKK